MNKIFAYVSSPKGMAAVIVDALPKCSPNSYKDTLKLFETSYKRYFSEQSKVNHDDFKMYLYDLIVASTAYKSAAEEAGDIRTIHILISLFSLDDIEDDCHLIIPNYSVTDNDDPLGQTDIKNWTLDIKSNMQTC